MHTITLCSRCGQDFMYHESDDHLFREPAENIEIKKDYPLQDDFWASRRWNEDKTESCDLSAWDVICQECDLKEKWVGKEVKIRESNEFNDYLNLHKLLVIDIVEEEYPLTVKIGETDSFAWFEEKELEIVS